MLFTVVFFMLDNLACLEPFTLDNVHSLSFSLFRLLRLTSSSGLHFFFFLREWFCAALVLELCGHITSGKVFFVLYIQKELK